MSLAVALIWSHAPAIEVASAPASPRTDATLGSLAGHVLPSDGLPAPTRVWVASPNKDAVPIVAPVSENGSFAAIGVPVGAVNVAVETAKGLYTVDVPITIAPGQVRRVQLALVGRQGTEPATSGSSKRKKAGGVFANPVYAALIVVGSAVVIGLALHELTKPDEKPASPSSNSQ